GRITGADGVTELPIRTRTLPPPTLQLQDNLYAQIGARKPVSIRVQGNDLSPDVLDIAVPEGRILEVLEDERGALIQWQPGAAPYPRAVPVVVRDRRHPGHPPASSVVRLSASTSLPISGLTEGDAVTIRIGDRNYGPVVADGRGQVQVSIVALPGDRYADVEVADRVGNIQRSQRPLGGISRPSLVGVVEGTHNPELPAPRLHLVARQVDGSAWRGEAPVCYLLDTQLAALSPVGVGRWTLRLPPSLADQRIDCVLQGQPQRFVAPLGGLPPETLHLRIDPPILSVDAPYGRIQAYLEDRLGRRAPSETIQLYSRYGQIQAIRPGGDGAYLFAEYNGEELLQAQLDVITAAWQRPSSTETVWGVALSVEPQSPTQLRVSGRALDASANPVRDTTLRIQAGEEYRDVITDADGWASATLPMPPKETAILVRSGFLVERALWSPGERRGPSPERPDLEATQEVRVQAGRIQELFVTIQPRIIQASSGKARLEVQPVDRAGNVVLDADLMLDASAGYIGMIEPEPDGRYFADYFPPRDMVQGEVRVTVKTADGGYSASTDLLIMPFVYNAVFNVSAGWVAGQQLDEWGGWMRYGRRLKSDALTQVSGDTVFTTWVHGQLGGYRQSARGSDPNTSSLTQVQQFTIPMSLGLTGRIQRRRLTGGIGAGFSPLVPYLLRRSEGDEEILNDWGVIAQGGELFAEVGLQSRNGNTEWVGQLRYFTLFEDPGAQIGGGESRGVFLTTGYSFLF
ncbi:MAG: hypothetical protein AAFV53_42130, partial [Myxococcota bacterium]